MGRAPCCDKSGVKKGPWTPEEDEKLVAYIKKHGQGNWRTLPKNAGLARCGKSCRLRWTNYLRPDIKRGRFTFQEEDTIIQLHSILGNKWSAIAVRLPGRTDNEIKNYWNTTIRKRLLRMGIDPVTHAPRLDLILDLDLDLDLSAAYCYCYPYPTQAAADLDTLRAWGLEPLANNYEPDPDLLRLASTLLLSGPAAPAIGDQQQLLPWTLQPATMAQQVVALPPPPQAEQFVAQHACQMPDLQMVHTNPTVQQHQLSSAQQQQHQPQDMMAVAACHSNSMQPPTGYVVDSKLDVPALMQMQMVQAADASNLQQWSSTMATCSSSSSFSPIEIVK